jgi:hypothetical protein
MEAVPGFSCGAIICKSMKPVSASNLAAMCFSSRWCCRASRLMARRALARSVPNSRSIRDRCDRGIQAVVEPARTAVTSQITGAAHLFTVVNHADDKLSLFFLLVFLVQRRLYSPRDNQPLQLQGQYMHKTHQKLFVLVSAQVFKTDDVYIAWARWRFRWWRRWPLAG